MKTQNLIKTLLISSQAFAIPDLGSFISNYKSAEIDEKTGEIKPPTKEIIFDTTKKNDDGVLKEAFKKMGLSEEDAKKEIEKLKNNIKKKIDSKEKYEIEEVGYLIANDKGEIIFKTTTTSSLLPENIGLNSLSFSREEFKQTPNIEKKTKDKTKEIKAEKQKIEKPKKEKKVEEKKEKTKKEKKSNKKLVTSLLIVFPILILIAAGYFFKDPLLEFGKGIFSVKDDNQNYNNNITQVDTNKTNNNNSNLNKEFGNDVEYRKILDAKIPKTYEVKLGEGYKKFYIIVGSFTIKENADNIVNNLKQQGYNPTILNNNQYYRVAIVGYDTADYIINEHKKLKNKYGNNMWLLINR